MEMTQNFTRIPVARVREGFNYRRRYDAAKLESLSADIRSNGLIQPVLVRQVDEDFQLIVGGRRFKAYVAAYGTEAEIPADVRVLTDAEATALMMSENAQREDPSVIEDAEGAARMLGLCNGDRDEAAARLGWDRKKLDRRLALMNATQKVRDAYLGDRIGVGHVEILAALRKEVQDKVIDKILEHPDAPTVANLKAMAENALRSLETAIFSRIDCAGCQFNTGNQQALFDESFSGSRCTNKDCYEKKTEAELEARRDKLTESYQVVRIVRAGDNATLIPLRADGKRGVGEEQAKACRTCGDFGACISGVPDTLGKDYREICFNKTCNDEKVKAFNDAQQAAAAAAAGQAPDAATAGATPAPSGDAAATTSSDPTPGRTGTGAAAPNTGTTSTASANSIRPVIKEYREEIWRAIFKRAVLKLDVMKSRALLLGILVLRSSYLDGRGALEAINKALGTDISVTGPSTQKVLTGLLQLDQAQLAKAFSVLPAFITKDMPITDVVGLLKALDVKIEQHWKLNETFLDILTKTEIDAVCEEIGLAKAAGKTYTSLKNGSKKDFITGVLKVQNFTYEGAVPKLMRWNSGV